MTDIIRHSPNDTGDTFAVATSIGSCGAIEAAKYAGGMVHVPSGSSITELQPYVSDAEDGTYTPVYKWDDNSQVKATVAAGRSYAWPDEIYAARWLKFLDPINSGTITISRKG